MTLPAFDYREPEDLAEAMRLLTEYGDDARLLAGGTALVLMLRYRLLRPRLLVSLERIPGLRGIHGNGELEIGPMVTHREIEHSEEVRAVAPLLAQAAARVGSPAIRNMGTIGGSVAHGEPNSDPAPALLALEARVRLAGPEGERVVPATGFFKDFYETDLRPGEIVVGLQVPRSPAGARSRFVKHTTASAEDRALVSVAAVFVPAADGACGDVRLALGGVAPTPVRAAAAEAALRGHPVTAERVTAAARLAIDATDPLSDRQGTADFRRTVTRVLVRRTLTALAGLAGPGDDQEREASRKGARSP
jgi:carbon-monoxide dehydrogenase medium subunit